ncbi:Nn.00g101440.m01.CDS01 [Neocucurbitaria sp. VM-36]
MSQSTAQDQQPSGATPGPTSEQPPAAPRPARSKNGCNACRRRKVRCNERRPRCAHCERLNLDCTWNRPVQGRSNTAQSSQSLVPTSPHAAQQQPFNPNLLPLDGFGMGGNAFFDFSGPLQMGTWDEAMLLSPNSWPSDPSIAAATSHLDPVPQPIYQLPLGHQSSGPPIEVAPAPRHRGSGSIQSLPDRGPHQPDPASTSPFSAENAPNGHVDEEMLLNTFLQMLMPPILTPVEIGPKWASTRAFFGTMAAESSIVRSAIMAFAAMQMQRSGLGGDVMKTDWRPLYDNAARQLSGALAKKRKNEENENSNIGLKHILASFFLLTYTDLLTETLPRAHANLREAYTLIQNANKMTFSVPERRLISWLRLLDARAVSTAGGEGLFLADTDETLFDASPAANSASEPETPDTEIEEILFDVLYHPGIVFYQKVQSFVGRITRIDPWHRSRGTVHDETDVMALAAQISNDLHALYGQRPALMDHAVAGNLTEKHLAKNLAAALTRSFRTYLANYYASFLHLHRVAYLLFPKTKDVITAIANIKRLAHLMAQTDESLPVNLLWPLLMWGSEEDNLEERAWIVEAIRGLESIATNAKATADLLEEVQRRQDDGKRRVDIRSVSQEYFASNHFAIV